MQPSIFNPWAWRDPSALAGGYTQTTPSVTPPEGQEDGHDGPDAPGPWIFGQKVLLPAGTVDRVDHQERVVYVDRTRQQIKDAPPFDQVSADQEYRERVGTYYADSYLPPPGAIPRVI
ncbi:PRC-barrel domain containing protein [Micromonospora sp. 050-3]|uniref:PRC-barrel domain containing protein n=1 Tax=Micromonospora sp. 050-3 TaxID=2789265 RepID=UPI00397D2C97